jgi:hypothetical protein
MATHRAYLSGTYTELVQNSDWQPQSRAKRPLCRCEMSTMPFGIPISSPELAEEITTIPSQMRHQLFYDCNAGWRPGKCTYEGALATFRRDLKSIR